MTIDSEGSLSHDLNAGSNDLTAESHDLTTESHDLTAGSHDTSNGGTEEETQEAVNSNYNKLRNFNKYIIMAVRKCYLQAYIMYHL